MLKRENLKLKTPKPEKKELPPDFSYEIRFEDGSEYRYFRKEDIELGQEVGAGYFGKVYEAVHKRSGKTMAVKKLLGVCQVDEAFLKELKFTKSIEAHENLVYYYGLTYEDMGYYYICTELMDTDLEKINKCSNERGQRFSDEFVAIVAASAVDGLKFLKDKYNLLHRDVQSTNILLNRKGQTKLCDFGVGAYLTRIVAKTTDLAMQNLSPERIETCGPYTVKADVWALGCTLMEIANGQHPYDDVYGYKLLVRIVEEDPPQMADNCGRSKELIEFINWCFVKKMKDRPDYNKLVTTSLYQQVKANISKAPGIVAGCVEEYLKHKSTSSSQ